MTHFSTMIQETRQNLSCRGCGYRLYHRSSVCPECGYKICWTDPSTFVIGGVARSRWTFLGELCMQLSFIAVSSVIYIGAASAIDWSPIVTLYCLGTVMAAIFVVLYPTLWSALFIPASFLVGEIVYAIFSRRLAWASAFERFVDGKAEWLPVILLPFCVSIVVYVSVWLLQHVWNSSPRRRSVRGQCRFFQLRPIVTILTLYFLLFGEEKVSRKRCQEPFS